MLDQYRILFLMNLLPAPADLSHSFARIKGPEEVVMFKQKAMIVFLKALPFLAMGSMYRHKWSLPNGGTMTLREGGPQAHFFLANSSRGVVYLDIFNIDPFGERNLRETIVVPPHGHLVRQLEEGDAVAIEDYRGDNISTEGTWHTLRCAS